MSINNQKEEEYVHILIEEHTGLKVSPSIKMRELPDDERDELLKGNKIYLCSAKHTLLLVKDDELYDIGPYTKIYHTNIGRNASMN